LQGPLELQQEPPVPGQERRGAVAGARAVIGVGDDEVVVGGDERVVAARALQLQQGGDETALLPGGQRRLVLADGHVRWCSQRADGTVQLAAVVAAVAVVAGKGRSGEPCNSSTAARAAARGVGTGS